MYFQENVKCNNDSKNVPEAIFPWIAAIFVKNDSSDQFDYYCDGALLSETIVITGTFMTMLQNLLLSILSSLL